jgi:demethylmenaquinone methyltransferase/2-methoxy-6-polyprenyl-1,4-benzoquinol methylase
MLTPPAVDTQAAAAGPDRDPVGVRRMFTAIAPRYDLANRLLSGGRDRAWRRVAARALALTPAELALDLACGTGDLAVALARGGGQVVGVDFTHAMLRHAAARQQPGRLLLAGGDALRLPFPDATFHVAGVAFGVRNFADFPAGLCELARVLRPGGRLGILEFSRPTGPLAPLARLYLDRVMPRLGRLISGREGPYDYLADSIRAWPLPAELARLLAAAGFVQVSWRSFTGSVAVLHLARRPD